MGNNTIDKDQPSQRVPWRTIFGLGLIPVVLLIVALAITVAVYGVVALIVKMDDLGLRMAQGGSALGTAVGTRLVRAMPFILSALSIIGIAAMIWVGGGIVLHGLYEFHLTPLPDWVDQFATSAGLAVPGAQASVAWIAPTKLNWSKSPGKVGVKPNRRRRKTVGSQSKTAFRVCRP